MSRSHSSAPTSRWAAQLLRASGVKVRARGSAQARDITSTDDVVDKILRSTPRHSAAFPESRFKNSKKGPQMAFRVSIIGGTGQVGAAVVRALAEDLAVPFTAKRRRGSSVRQSRRAPRAARRTPAA